MMTSSHASLLSAARAAGATVLETPGVVVMVLSVAPAAPAAADLLPLVDAARTAATSVRVLRNAIRAGELSAVGRQRDRAVRRADLEAWIGGRRVGAPPDGDETEAAVERILARKKRNRLNSPGNGIVYLTMTKEWRVGDRVEGGEGEDHDTGRIVSIADDGDTCEIAWDSGDRTPCNLSALRPEA